MHNIFQLWKAIGKQVPFAVRRYNWSDEHFTVVESVTVRRWPYGEATGYSTHDGVRDNHYEYSAEWRERGLIPNAGSYQWSLVEHSDFPFVIIPVEEPKPHKVIVLELSSRLRFGKHKGETVQHVLDTEPTYLCWVMKNVETVAFHPSILQTLDSSTSPPLDPALKLLIRARYDATQRRPTGAV